MTLIKGVWGAVDNVAAVWRNDIEDIRAEVWEVFGRSQGVLRGLTMAPDPGSLTVTFQPGAAIIEQRGTDITGDARGYFVYYDATFQVPFNTPSASSRNDALVFAWADPQYGALGASVSSPGGPQVVVVPGVSGSTTPRTDAQIQTAIGPGGWFRFADVIIAPGNTSVQSGNITRTFVDANDYIGNRRTLFKSAQQSLAASTTPVNDTHLQFTGQANANYKVKCSLFWLQPGGATSSMDGKLGLTVPSGSWQGGVHGPEVNIASGDSIGQGQYQALNGAVTATIPFGVINATGLITLVTFDAMVSVGSTGGLVALRWAQNTSAAGSLTLNSGSFMEYERVS